LEEEGVNRFICHKCKKECITMEEGMTICWTCYKILRHQYEKMQKLRDQSMLWKYHSNTMPVDKNTKGPYNEDVVLYD
jgi:hypothetical protein